MPEYLDRSKRGTLLAGVSLFAVAACRASVAATPSQQPIEQPAERNDLAFIGRAFTLRRAAIDSGDQAYGALVVREGRIIGQSPSRVVQLGDPTAHAEMEAIRDAASRLGSRNLAGCTLYSSSSACPMCEAAAYWAGIERQVSGREGQEGRAPRLCG